MSVLVYAETSEGKFKKSAFEVYADKVSEKRRKVMNLHIHPISAPFHGSSDLLFHPCSSSRPSLQ